MPASPEPFGRLGQSRALANAMGITRQSRSLANAMGITRQSRSLANAMGGPRNELIRSFIERNKLDQTLGATSPILARRLALDRMRATDSRAVEPQWLVRLREFAEGFERYTETQSEAIERFGRMEAERRLRTHREHMAVLGQMLQETEVARCEAEVRAVVAERDLRRIADAAEEMRADVAAARQAQGQAEARATTAEAREARHRKRMLLVAIGAPLLTIAANVALRLAGL